MSLSVQIRPIYNSSIKEESYQLHQDLIIDYFMSDLVGKVVELIRDQVMPRDQAMSIFNQAGSEFTIDNLRSRLHSQHQKEETLSLSTGNLIILNSRQKKLRTKIVKQVLFILAYQKENLISSLLKEDVKWTKNWIKFLSTPFAQRLSLI